MPYQDYESEDMFPKKRSSEEDHSDASPTKKVKTPRKKAAPKGPATSKTPKQKTSRVAATPKSASAGIPRSWEEAGPADRMIVTMKKDGKSTKEIKAAYEAMTGKTVGKSTIPNRLMRLNANFARLDDGDHVKLLDAVEQWELEKAELIKQLESSKWSRIIDMMQEAGSQKYQSNLVQKELKKIQEAQAAGTYVPSVQKKTNRIDEAGADESLDDVQVKDETGHEVVEEENDDNSDIAGEDGADEASADEDAF